MIRTFNLSFPKDRSKFQRYSQFWSYITPQVILYNSQVLENQKLVRRCAEAQAYGG